MKTPYRFAFVHSNKSTEYSLYSTHFWTKETYFTTPYVNGNYFTNILYKVNNERSILLSPSMKYCVSGNFTYI